MSTDMTQGGDAPLYEVYDIESTFGPTSLGGSNRIMRVHFHVLGMQDQYVDIPYAQFNAQAVTAKVEELVMHLIDVRSLKGTI